MTLQRLTKSFFKIENVLLAGVVFVVLATVLGLAIGVPLSLQKRDYLSEANEILDSNVLIDGHNDFPHMVRKNFKNRFGEFNFTDMRQHVGRLNGSNQITHTDLTRLRQGKLGAQFWAAYADCDTLAKDAARIHLEQIDVIKRLVRRHPDQLEFVTDSSGIRAAFKNKKIASLIGVESGHAIDSSLALLRILYELGARYMTLTHNCNVPWATNHLVDRNETAAAEQGGLSAFGRKVIQEMNRLGMMIDLSHTSHRTQLDAMSESNAPVIYSHSSAYSVCNATRNVRNDVLLQLVAFFVQVFCFK
jgi:membrane dipeptidase